MEPSDPWVRLGALLKARRVALDPQYKSREKFAKATGLNERLISDLENARRQGYRDTTVHAVEAAYQWAEGSFERALKGGEPATAARGTAHVALSPEVVAKALGLSELPPGVDRTSLPPHEVHLYQTPDLTEHQRDVLVMVSRAVTGQLGPEETWRLARELFDLAEQAHLRRHSRNSG